MDIKKKTYNKKQGLTLKKNKHIPLMALLLPYQ
jgi:hypothetical protein